MNSTPFDLTCHTKLHERFSFLFEEKLIKEICQAGILKRYSDQDIIMDIGQTIKHMPLVVSGTVRIMTEDDEGDELILYYLEYGDTCAVTLKCCTSTSISKLRAVAETECEILFIPVERLESWMVKFSTWRSFVLDSYNDKLHEMLNALDHIVFNDMEARLRKYLIDKSLIAKSKEINISHQIIATELHSSRVVISRLMKKLEKIGFLNQYRNKIILL